MSALINGKLSGFSTVRLFRFLNSLGRDVEIVLKDKPKSRSQTLTQVVTKLSDRHTSAIAPDLLNLKLYVQRF